MKITPSNADHLVTQALREGKSLLYDTMQAAEDQLWILRKQGAVPASSLLYTEELPRVQQHERLAGYLAASREGATFPLGRKAQVAVYVWCKLWDAHSDYIRELDLSRTLSQAQEYSSDARNLEADLSAWARAEAAHADPID